jgi:L-amino acid N-acyltransferase YncA
MHIRPATDTDVRDILEIYNEIVETTFAIYDERPSTLAEREAWFQNRMAGGWPVLVAQEAGRIAGFSSFAEWRSRWGYRYTVEHSVHVRAEQRGRGIGSKLLEALFPLAAQAGKHTMIAHIDSLAEASVRLHARLGFEPVGTFREVGRKADRWLSVITMQRMITPADCGA